MARSTTTSIACAPAPEDLERLAAQTPAGPLVVISRSGALRALDRLRSALPGVGVHYALKACSERALLEALAEAGCGFELASAGELPSLAGLGVAGERLLCGNPVRSLAQTAALHAAGVALLAADSVEEVVRSAQAAPGARLLLRVAVPPAGSAAEPAAEAAWWPMGDTFGALPEAWPAIAAAARAHGVDIAGVCFHVGSQCTEPQAWVRGLATAADALAKLRALGHGAGLLSLGGGFPVALAGAPQIEAIGAALAPALAALPGGTAVVAEPGRYLAGSAGVLLTRVSAVRSHRGARWLQLDCGLHNGLIESSRGVPYRIRRLRDGGAPAVWRIAGPSCDGADRLAGEWPLPADTAEGDWLAVEGAAAYAQSRASAFNGLAQPVTVISD